MFEENKTHNQVILEVITSNYTQRSALVNNPYSCGVLDNWPRSDMVFRPGPFIEP